MNHFLKRHHLSQVVTTCKGVLVYHVGPFCCERRVSFVAVGHGVEHSVLHKDAHSSTDEGGEEVNVNVITCTVEAPAKSW